MSNLFFSSAEALSKEDLKKKFVSTPVARKNSSFASLSARWTTVAQLLHQEDFSELLASFGGNAATDRLSLVVYKNLSVRWPRKRSCAAARISGFGPRMLRNIEGIGNDSAVFITCRIRPQELPARRWPAFGTAQNGLPPLSSLPRCCSRRSKWRRTRRTQALAAASEPPMSARGSL